MNRGIGIAGRVNEIIHLALHGVEMPAPVVRRPSAYYRKARTRMFEKSNLCHWCEKEMDRPTLDHRIPLSKGGLDHSNNYVLAHRECNQSKADKMPHEI